MSPDLQRFLTAAVFFHLAFGAMTVLLYRRAARRLAKPLPAWLWLLHAAADSFLFGTALLFSACIAGILAGHSFFSMARFAGQGLFGEGVLLALASAALHVRSPGGRRRALLPLAVGLLLLVVYWEAYHREPHDLQVRRYEVDLTRGRPAAGSLRLVHLSDIQTPEIGAYEERVLREAAALQPDLLVFTGDYLQDRLTPTRVRAAADLNALLRRIAFRPQYGAYAVEGDCEWTDWPEIFARTGIRTLHDESVRVALPGGRSLALVGFGLAASRARRDGPRPPRLLEPVEDADYRIVIGHSPDYVSALPQSPHVDLALAGHTHGGQVVLPLLGPPVTFSRLPNQYAGGLHRYRDTLLHVSRGVGMERFSAPEVRFLCPPEISLLTLRY